MFMRLRQRGYRPSSSSPCICPPLREAMLAAEPDEFTGVGVAISEIRLLPARGAGFERRRFWLRQLFEELILGRTDASAALLIFRVGAIPRAPKLGCDPVVAAALADQRLQIRLAEIVVGDDGFVVHRHRLRSQPSTMSVIACWGICRSIPRRVS